MTRRRWHSLPAFVAALLAFATLGACGGDQPAALTCATPSEGLEVVDEQSGLRLCLPPNWRRLRAGDPGWLTIFDEADSHVERNVREGSLRIFAVPLQPRETDLLLNLSVYVYPTAAGKTVDEEGRAYEESIRKIEPAVTDIVSGTLALPVGPAFRISGTRPRGETATDRFSAYIVLVRNQAYYVIYVSSTSQADRYADMFLMSANSIEVLEPRP